MKKVSTILFVLFLLSFNLLSSNWEKVIYDPAVINLNDVCTFSESGAIAVGDYGVIRYTHDRGDTWPAVMLPDKVNLYGVAMRDSVSAVAVGSEGAVYISSDKGITWQFQKIPAIELEDNLKDIVFYDSNNGVIAGDKGVIFFTSDGGASWQKASNKNEDNLKSIVYANADIVICAGDGGTVLVSTNSGSDWSPGESNTKANLKLVRAPDEGHIYIVGDSLTVLISNDLGMTWKTGKLNTTNPNFKRPEIKGFVFFDSLFGIVRVDDISSLTIIHSEISTTDGGKTWKYNEPGGMFTPIAFVPVSFDFFNKNFGVCVGVEGEIYTLGLNGPMIDYRKRAENSSHFFKDITTLGTASILAVYSTGTPFYAVLSEDAGITWKTLPAFDTIGRKRGINYFQDLTYPDKNTIYIAENNSKDSSWKEGNTTKTITSYFGYLLKSTDKGNSWKEFVFPNKARVERLIMLDKDDGIAQLGRKYFYRTDNGWETYDSVYAPDTTIYYINQVFYPEKMHYVLSATKKDNSRIFYYSSDGGATWDSNFKTPGSSLNMYFIDKDRVFSWNLDYDSLENKYYDVMYKSYDRGNNWEEVMYEESVKNYSLSRLYFDGNIGIAHKSQYNSKAMNYYFTVDEGENWELDSIPGLKPYEHLTGMAILNHQSVYAIGYSGSMMRYNISKTSARDDFDDVPGRIIRIVPNPANDFIILDGILPGQSFVIYSLIGSKMAESTYSGIINVSSLLPGVYVIKSGNKSAKFIVTW